jgi:uncharacterized protein
MDPSQPHGPESDASTSPPGPAGRERLLARNPWIIYVLPLAVFMILGAFEPTPEPPAEPHFWDLPYGAYPLAYTLKIALTTAAIAFVWPGYRQFRVRLSGWSLLVGVGGVIVWVGLWKLQLEQRLLSPLGLDTWLGLGARSAFNPLAELSGRPALAYGFLAVRFFGLACVIALAEEFFLRGFLMRFVIRPDWWNVPFGQVTPTAVAVGTVVPMLMHPAELLAAAAWFSLVTWLMIRTRSIWDCVAAHAITNLLLGLYVVWSGDWALL